MVLFSKLALATPLVIDPSNPPEARVLDNEKARLHLVNQKVDVFMEAHATLKEGERQLTDEFMSEVNAIVASYGDWKDKLFLIKAIVADIDDLTGTQQDTFRTKIVEVMGELYTIRKTSQDLRNRIGKVASDVYNVRDFGLGYLTSADSGSFPDGSDVFTNINSYKTSLLTSFDNLREIISSDVENSMYQSIVTTKQIVDELFLIRSLEYPELASQLELLRDFTIANEVIEPRFKEVQETKYAISNLIAEYRPYSALDVYIALVTRVTELSAEITSSGLSAMQVADGIGLLTDELDAAYAYVDQPSLFPLQVKQRYSNLNVIVNVCTDATHSSWYNYNCAALKGIYGMSPQTVVDFDEEKLRYLAKQMDLVFAGAMGND